MDFSQIQSQTFLNIDLFFKKKLFSSIASNLRQLDSLPTFFKKLKTSSNFNPLIDCDRNYTEEKNTFVLPSYQISIRSAKSSLK